MNNKTVPLIIVIVTILVITAFIWLVLWQSIGPTNQNQNVNQVNTNQSDQGIVYFELDKEFWMAKDQIAVQKGEDLTIELKNITYSPCPKGAVCVWSGLGANIEVSKGVESKELSLVLSGTITVFRFEINLLQVQKDKVSFIVKKSQKLTLSTNKNVYQKGEEVKITIDNNSSDDVVIKSPYYEIRSAGSTDEKDKIKIIRCPCGMVCEALAPFLTLKKGEKLEYTWNQANQRCEGDTQINEQVAVGSYRVVSYLKNDKEWQDFIYADFTIREKSAEVTITTDKTLYQKGEPVKITVANNTSQKIGFDPISSAHYTVILYKKVNTDAWWVISLTSPTSTPWPPPETRDWSVILDTGEQHSFNWDQKIFDVVLDEYVQAAVGTYRFQLQWYYPKTNQGDISYSNEFIIKEKVSDCDQSEQDIKQKMEQANYCQTKDDCTVSTEFSCPFGCYQLFNKTADLTEIQNLVKLYNQSCAQCLYDCMVPPTPMEIKCINNKCIWEMV